MNELKKLCVFCGTRSGNDSIYNETAEKLGTQMAAEGIELIYGAGGKGVMGALANSVKKNGGKITGMTIKKLFDLERPDMMESKLDRMEVYDHMYTRKVAMTSGSDAFVILPGGYGTMDELFELLVLKQLHIIDKPIVVLNVNYFFDNLKSFIHQFIRDGFIDPKNEKLLTYVDTWEEVIPTVKKELNKHA